MKRMFSCSVLFMTILLCLGTNSQKFGSMSDLQCNCAGTTDCDPDNGFCPNGCQPGWFGPGCQIGNIAFMKAANQSSTHTDLSGYVYGASRAVDGRVPSISELGWWCSDTLQTTEKTWWYVQLGNEPYVVQNVTLYNKLNEYKTRLRKFSILLSNDTNNVPNLSSWLTCAYQEAYLEVVGTYSCSQRLAKRVGVYLDFSEYLAICEAIVIGYKFFACADPSTTGPGCLLKTCTSKACTDASGVCDSYKACQFPRCPGDTHWPPECWIRMPSLSSCVLTAVTTCDVIAVNLTGIQGGNLAISRITVEINSAEGATQQAAIDFNGSYIEPFTAKVKATAGKSYVLSFRPTVCLDGQCKNGPASKTVKVLTKVRRLTYVVDGSCAYFSLTLPHDGCEIVKSISVSCLDIARAVKIAGNGATVCGIDTAVTYRCKATVVNSQDLKEEYAVTFMSESSDGAGSWSRVIADDEIDKGIASVQSTCGNTKGAIIGGIVGGSLGGAAAIICLIIELLLIFRRRKINIRKTEMGQELSQRSEACDVVTANESSYQNRGIVARQLPNNGQETSPRHKGMTSKTMHGQATAKPGCERQMDNEQFGNPSGADTPAYMSLKPRADEKSSRIYETLLE